MTEPPTLENCASKHNEPGNQTFEITFCTGNEDKLIEFRQLIQDLESIKFSAASVDLPELQGDPSYITRAKCRKAFELLQKPVIVEDVSLFFNALGGLPGPYIRHFLTSLQPEGLVKLLSAFEDKRAKAVCIFAYWDGLSDEVFLFEGVTEGHIVEPRGPHTFGWDPIFQPNGCKKTYAEMEKSEKHLVSHRAKAMSGLKEFLRDRCA